MTTGLHFAAQNGDRAEIERLVRGGADVNCQNDGGHTPLQYASAEPCPATLRLLLALGASATLADNRGITPLHLVAAHGFYPEAIEMAQILLAAGADPNARMELGLAPLHSVYTKSMIDLLIEHGADPEARNSAGETPAEFLLHDRNFDEAEHLRRRAAGRV